MLTSCLNSDLAVILVFEVVASKYALHSPNARNVTNWKRNFKVNIIEKYLGKRIMKEVVTIRIESYFFCVSLRYEMFFNVHLTSA